MADDMAPDLHHDFHVTLAADEQAGVNAWQRHRHRVVLSDIRMPRLSGVGLHREIKAIDPQQPIILTSSYLGDVQVSLSTMTATWSL